jgi:hypothetical protein
VKQYYVVKEERNILRTIKVRTANLIGYVLRRNCLLKHVSEGKIEGRIEMTGRQGRRHKQLLCDFKESRALSAILNSSVLLHYHFPRCVCCAQYSCFLQFLNIVLSRYAAEVFSEGF